MRTGRARASLLGAGVVVLALALLAPPIASSASAGKSARKQQDHARSYVLQGKRRSYRRAGSQRIWLPMGPASIYYDYPYEYSRGRYPTHIGGYVYYVPKPAFRCRKCAARHREGCRCR